ncbi:MAG: site-specific integrase [Gemmatimonadetes bacterium]|nr:site-specific integrase [Gemmatimonadota bacterium]
MEKGGQLGYAGVGARQVQYDLQFLRALLNWAVLTGMIAKNPVAGFKLPRNPSPAQPAIYEEEYQAMLAVVESTPKRRGKRGASERQPTRDELIRRRLQLVLLNESGHRGQSVRHLRWSDIDGAGERIGWDARYDKQRKEHWTALSPAAVQELRAAQAALRAIGDALVFPSPIDPAQPMSRSLFGKWFKAAARAAGIERARVGTHSMRRKAASEISPEDAKVAADALGMSVMTLLTIYRQSTLDRQREAQAARKPLRMDGRTK